jgi:hypothetical protein
MDFSRPTKSGTTMWGKTMMSRSGKRGRLRLRSLPSFLSSPRENMDTVASAPCGAWQEYHRAARPGTLVRALGRRGTWLVPSRRPG